MTTTVNDPQLLIDVRTLVGAADLTGATNKVSLELDVDPLDKTTFASGGARARVGGLLDTMIGLDGFWAAGEEQQPDDALMTGLGTLIPVSMWPELGSLGSPCYVAQVLECDYKPGGEVGKLLGFSAGLKGNRPTVRGTTLHPIGTPRTTSGTATGYQLGALAAADYLYVNLHVLGVTAVSGTPTLTIIIESDDNSGFTTPTTRSTFTTVSAIGAQTARIAGAVTDTWWRAKWTIAGGATTPSTLFAVAAGIGPR